MKHVKCPVYKKIYEVPKNDICPICGEIHDKSCYFTDDKPKYDKIIAVDFDGTLCVNKWPEIGEANQKLLKYLREEQKKGTKLILWTNRAGKELKDAVTWCKRRKLYFDAVNANLPSVIEHFGVDSRKVYANEYIDDRNSTAFELPFKGEKA